MAKYQGATIGALNVYSGSAHAFGEQDAQVAAEIADFIAVAVSNADAHTEAAQQAAETLVSAVTAGRSTVPVATTAVEGPAGEVLVHAAEGADLLVVGGRGHGAIRGMLLGSVALHCVVHAPGPVMVVRADK